LKLAGYNIKEACEALDLPRGSYYNIHNKKDSNVGFQNQIKLFLLIILKLLKEFSGLKQE